MVDDDRKQEDTLLKNFDCDHPLLLGSLLDMAVKALNLIPTFDTPKYSRMGLFACIGEGIQRVSGYEKDSLKNRLAEGTDIAYHVSIEHSTVASTLILLMEMEPYQGGWQGTASQLLNLLKTTAKKTETHETLPKTAHTLTSELRKLESALDNFGIRIEYHRNMALRTLKISKFTSTSEQKKDPADPPNPDNIPDPTTIKLHIPQKDSILPKNDNEIPFVEEM